MYFQEFRLISFLILNLFFYKITFKRYRKLYQKDSFLHLFIYLLLILINYYLKLSIEREIGVIVFLIIFFLFSLLSQNTFD